MTKIMSERRSIGGKAWVTLGGVLLGLSVGCSSGGDGGPGGMSGDLDPQLPPTDKEGIATWLEAFEEEGWESEWFCEPEPTEKTEGAAAIHVHGTTNRVCSNQKLGKARLGAGEQVEQGSVALKFVSSGTYVSIKAEADSDEGRGWYYYAPGGSVADFGASACVGCHAAAGSDADHPGLGDYVYFQVEG